MPVIINQSFSKWEIQQAVSPTAIPSSATFAFKCSNVLASNIRLWATAYLYQPYLTSEPNDFFVVRSMELRQDRHAFAFGVVFPANTILRVVATEPLENLTVWLF